MQLSHESRTALARAAQFHRLAAECQAANRVDYEAFVEAAIVFAGASLHRLQTEHERHPDWRAWWNGLRGNESVEFFRTERDWLLKEAPPRMGQRGFAASVGSNEPSYVPSKAAEFYFFSDPHESATETIGRHLHELEAILGEAANKFQ